MAGRSTVDFTLLLACVFFVFIYINIGGGWWLQVDKEQLGISE